MLNKIVDMHIKCQETLDITDVTYSTLHLIGESSVYFSNI